MVSLNRVSWRNDPSPHLPNVSSIKNINPWWSCNISTGVNRRAGCSLESRPNQRLQRMRIHSLVLQRDSSPFRWLFIENGSLMRCYSHEMVLQGDGSSMARLFNKIVLQWDGSSKRWFLNVIFLQQPVKKQQKSCYTIFHNIIHYTIRYYIGIKSLFCVRHY